MPLNTHTNAAYEEDERQMEGRRIGQAATPYVLNVLVEISEALSEATVPDLPPPPAGGDTEVALASLRELRAEALRGAIDAVTRAAAFDITFAHVRRDQQGEAGS